MSLLEVHRINTMYGDSHVLFDLSLRVEQGEVVALLGRNGAGKTTTLRSLMGLTPARRGKVTIFGEETTHWPAFRIASRGVGYVPEGRRIFPNLSVEDNLKVPIERAGPWTIERVYQLFPRLAERRQVVVAELEALQTSRAGFQVELDAGESPFARRP